MKEAPPSVYWDEASIGYNAFSVSQTLKDEWGEFLPIHFRAFGEFKLPVYIYSVVPFIKLFGLNEFSVRFPAVIYSLLSVMLVYIIGKKLGGGLMGLLSAFFLTISPWFFIFSRTGYEATAGLAFFLMAIYLCFFCTTRKAYMLGALFLVISIYSYNSFRIISPIVFLTATFIKARHSLKKDLKTLLIAVIFFGVSMIPVVRLFIYDAGSGRSQAFSLIPSLRQVYDSTGNPRLQLIFDRNADISWLQNFKQILGNYLSHFGPGFLFSGDRNTRSQQPSFGQIYFLDVFLFIAGALSVSKKRESKLYTVIFLFLIGIVPVALFKEAPHALRSLAAVPFLVLLCSLGVNYFRERFKKFGSLIPGVIVVGYILFFENYYLNFLEHYSFRTSQDWQYGYSQVFTKYQVEIEKHDRVVITDEYGQPYIFALYYLKYDPVKFISEKSLNPVNNWGFSIVKNFGKFEFRKATKEDFGKGNLLFVTQKEAPENLKPDSQILNLDGSTSLLVYE